MALFGELLLFAGSVGGVILPVLYRIRCVGPPRGVAVFGACLSIGPILGLLVKALR